MQPNLKKFDSAFQAQMAESVDALVSNTSGATHPGSSPGLGTKLEKAKVLQVVRPAALFIFPIFLVRGKLAGLLFLNH